MVCTGGQYVTACQKIIFCIRSDNLERLSFLSLFPAPCCFGSLIPAEGRAFKNSPVQDQSERHNRQQKPVPVITAHMKGDAEQAQGIMLKVLILSLKGRCNEFIM